MTKPDYTEICLIPLLRTGTTVNLHYKSLLVIDKSVEPPVLHWGH